MSDDDSSANEFDSDLEEEIQLSKLENMQVELKQTNYLLGALLLKKQKISNHMIQVMYNLDKLVMDYNFYYFRKRTQKLTYFKIDPLAIKKQDDVFAIRLLNKQGQPEQRGYFLNFVFEKDTKSNYYRMHVEIWKQQLDKTITNKVLQRFQKNCHTFLMEKLNELGFFSHIEGSAIVLRHKQPTRKNQMRMSNQGLNLIENIKFYAQKFLHEMASILNKQKPCIQCEKFLLYESKQHAMMPPTIIISSAREPTTKEYKFKLLHESCAAKYLKPPPYPTMLKQNNSKQ